MDISIILCTRNRAKSLTLCLDAVAMAIGAIAEQKKSCEIVLVDNGSTDNTPSVVEGWCAAHPNIVVNFVYEQKAGLSNARNYAITIAKGDLLVLTDDDCCIY